MVFNKIFLKNLLKYFFYIKFVNNLNIKKFNN